MGKDPSKENSVIPIEDPESNLRYIAELVVIRTASTDHFLTQRKNIATSIAKLLKNLRNFCKEHRTTAAQDEGSSIILLDIITQLIGLSTTINILLQLEVPAAEFLNIKSEVFNRTVQPRCSSWRCRELRTEHYGSVYVPSTCLAPNLIALFIQNCRTEYLVPTLIAIL